VHTVQRLIPGRYMDITKRYKRTQLAIEKNYLKGWWCDSGFMYESGYEKRDKKQA